jgi:hypothetical protein
MRKSALLATSLLALATFAHAAPTEINYQGVLTDQNGNPVNGVRAMQIKIYDAPTGGTLLYSEDLGNVPVQDGIYSFSFGANGTSNALTTETIAIANGTVSTFQKVLTAPTVVAGSVTVTDGTYTWDQTSGSSNENDFSVAYSPNLRRVTVTYYSGAPAAGKNISAKFRAPGSGINGALGDIRNAWSEVSIGGTPQNTRQKVLAVPFALKAGAVDIDSISNTLRTVQIPIKQFSKPANDEYDQGYGLPDTVFPLKSFFTNSWAYYSGGKGQWQIPFYVRKIHSIQVTYKTTDSQTRFSGGTAVSGEVSFFIFGSSWQGITLQRQPTYTTSIISVDLSIPFGESWSLKFYAKPYGGRAYEYISDTNAEILDLSINADVFAFAVPKN